MPKTKFQDFVYTVIMVFVMVYTMICYNIAIDMGEMSNKVFVAALGELPIMVIIAFILEFFFIGKLAQKLAFRLVNPEEDKSIVVILTISSFIVCLMCPIMSLLGCAIFKFDGMGNLFADWLQLWAVNFPMALCFQIFYAGPFVRFIFKKLFAKQLEK